MTNARTLERTIGRRPLLGGLVAITSPFGLLSSCSGEDQPEPEQTPDPDEALRSRVADGERDLLDLYAAVSLQYPDLAEPLAAFADRHTQHLRAMQSDLAELPAASPGASAGASYEVSPGADMVAGPSPTSAPPGTLEAALAALREAERRASESKVVLCAAATDPAVARLLASIAGCEAAHAALLGSI